MQEKKVKDELVDMRLADLQNRLSAVLNQTRENYDISIKTQAKKMGVSDTNLTKYTQSRADCDNPEKKPPKMGVDKLIRICEYFDVSADYMLGLTSDSKLMRRHTPDEAAIKQMCDYTGLSRQAIETLHKKKEDFLFSAGLTYLLSAKKKLLSSVIEYLLTCLHDVTAKDERYSHLPGIRTSSEAGKCFFYDIIEELPQARTQFYNLVMANEILRKKYAREMALKCVDREEVFYERYPNLSYEPELSSEELSRKNQEAEDANWSELFIQDDSPYDIPEPQFDENDPQVIRDNQYDGFLEDLRNHLAEKNKA